MSNLLVINHIIHQNIYFGEYIILIKQKMASLKIKYRHSSIEGKAGTLFYQVIHNRVARQINSGYKIYPDEWGYFQLPNNHTGKDRRKPTPVFGFFKKMYKRRYLTSKRYHDKI